MPVHLGVHTLRDAGFKLGGAYHGLGEVDQWVIVGQWIRLNVRENLNATIQIEQIRDTFGPRRCCELQRGDLRIIAADDTDDVAVLVAEQHKRYEVDGMIDDAAYRDAIAPQVEQAWTELPPIERIRLIRRCDTKPDLLFAQAVPQEFFSEVAAMVEACSEIYWP